MDIKKCFQGLNGKNTFVRIRKKQVAVTYVL